MPNPSTHFIRSWRQKSNHSRSVPGFTKNCISICSNSRVRKMKLPGVISFRNALPICAIPRSEEHTSELQSRSDLVCRLLLEKKKRQPINVRRNLHERRELSQHHKFFPSHGQ